MHLFGCTGNRIYRAGLQAQRAADANIFVDESDSGRLEYDILVKRFEFDTEQIRQLAYTFFAAGRTMIDVRFFVGNGLRIGPATGIAALSALRLRQQVVYPVCQRNIDDLGIKHSKTLHRAKI